MDKIISLIVGAAVIMMVGLVLVFSGSSSLIDFSDDTENTQTSAICEQEARKYCNGDINSISSECSEAVKDRCNVPDEDILADSDIRNLIS